jgi:ABC-type transporter Mla subunit MlaD
MLDSMEDVFAMFELLNRLVAAAERTAAASERQANALERLAKVLEDYADPNGKALAVDVMK